MDSRGNGTSNATQFDLHGVQNGVAVARLNDRAFLRITGEDATRWLNGMVTNSIQALQPGEGNYNFLLSAQGRIQGDCTIFREPGEPASFLLETSGDQVDTIKALLDKFIIMDDVELTRVFEGEQNLLLLGSGAAGALRHLGLPHVELNHCVLANTADGEVRVFGAQLGTTPAFQLLASSATIASLEVKVAANFLNADELEAFRIYAGVPRFGTDIRDRDLPQETNQAQALHFAKGCYLGQEIVERIRSRGQVHRLLTPFLLNGEIPQLPATLEASGKPAGEISSAVRVGEVIYALGYARREALELKQTLTYAGGTATTRTS